jgi:diguanylate cyclase (GGDEF)-like protein/PAS domain S-box-containing protein
MQFSVKHKLLLLLAGTLIIAFGLVMIALGWLTERQQAQSSLQATHVLLQDVGTRITDDRLKLTSSTVALAGRGDMIATLAFLANHPIPENVRLRVLDAEKKKLAIELSKYADTFRIDEIGIYDGEGHLVAFARKNPSDRDGFAIGIGTWRDCRLHLSGSTIAGLDWVSIDRPAGMPATTDEFGNPAAPQSSVRRQNGTLLLEAATPMKLMNSGQARRVGWVRTAQRFLPAAPDALARQWNMEILLLLSGSFDSANPLGLRPGQLDGAWPILDGSTPRPANPALPQHPQFFLDAAALALEGGETAWFVALLDRSTASHEQQEVLGKAMTAIGGALLLLLPFALWVSRRWIGQPLGALRNGVQAYAGGQLGRRIDLRSGDEFAALGKDFDQLAEQLHKREIALRECDDRWQFALEGTGHGVWDLNPLTGAVFFSPAWRRMLGYSSEDVPNTLAAWRALIHPEDQPHVRLAFENHLRGSTDTSQTVYRMRAKNGDYRWVMSSARLLRDAGGKPLRMLGTNTDITEQRYTQQRLEQLMTALNESEAHFRRFFDEAKAVMLLIDPADGRIIDANPAACAFYGYERAELLALHITDISQMTQAEMTAEVAQALAEHHGHSILQHRLKDGTFRTVEMYSSPYHFDKRLALYSIIHDITERIEAERELREAATVFEATAEAIMITDASGVIKRINQAFVTMTGYSTAEVQGQTPRLLKSDKHDELFYQGMWEKLHAAGRWEGEIWNRRKNGEIFPVWQIISTVRDPQGQAVGFVSLFIDITQKKRDEDEIAYRANYDALTGLPNRNLLAERLNQALKQARRENSRVAVMFIDLDFFKQVNDTLGHAIGDRLLQLVAERMRLCVRETDTIARLGGDEFVILLTDIDDTVPASIVAEKIITLMVEAFSIEGNEIHIGASIGITLFPDDGRDVETLFRNADLAMYRAKNTGRNNAQFFEMALTTAALDRRELENDLRGALARNEFRLHFQPLINLATSRITGVEALLRWQHPQRGQLEPERFIPLAEETGLIRDIGAWVLAESCRQLAGWEAAGHHLTLAINVSVRQLPEALSVKRILAVLAEHGLDPQQIVLEITESVLLVDSPTIQQWFVDAGAAGLHLAIDDFGTGYSSLAYLKRFPVRHVKIDKTFVQDMEGDTANRALVEAILAMAHSLGLSVVAEGVEALGQASLLQERSCEMAQGYLYSQPLPAEELLALLNKTPS